MFTIETIEEIVDLMARYKMNVLQLYIEHTFAFEKHSSFCKDVGAITPEFIRQIQKYCKSKYIELQANLQSLDTATAYLLNLNTVGCPNLICTGLVTKQG